MTPGGSKMLEEEGRGCQRIVLKKREIMGDEWLKRKKGEKDKEQFGFFARCQKTVWTSDAVVDFSHYRHMCSSFRCETLK